MHIRGHIICMHRYMRMSSLLFQDLVFLYPGAIVYRVLMCEDNSPLPTRFCGGSTSHRYPLPGRLWRRNRPLTGRVCVGCGRGAPSHPLVAGVGGRCVICSALEDLRLACLELDRESPAARTVVEVCWSLRRLCCSTLFDQAFEAGPVQFSAYLRAQPPGNTSQSSLLSRTMPATSGLNMNGILRGS